MKKSELKKIIKEEMLKEVTRSDEVTKLFKYKNTVANQAMIAFSRDDCERVLKYYPNEFKEYLKYWEKMFNLSQSGKKFNKLTTKWWDDNRIVKDN